MIRAKQYLVVHEITLVQDMRTGTGPRNALVSYEYTRNTLFLVRMYSIFYGRYHPALRYPPTTGNHPPPVTKQKPKQGLSPGYVRYHPPWADTPSKESQKGIPQKELSPGVHAKVVPAAFGTAHDG